MPTRQQLYYIFIWLLKNLLIFMVGAALGIFVVFINADSLLKAAIPKDIGLGVIAVAPILILFYAMFFGTIGGVIAILLYYVIKFLRGRRAARARLEQIRKEHNIK
jgi:hypothetical protein